MMSFLASTLPLAVTRLVFPAPAPGSVNIFAWLLIHCFQSRCIFSSGSFLFSGEVFFQSSITEAGAIYRTRNFFIGTLLEKRVDEVKRADANPRLESHLIDGMLKREITPNASRTAARR